MTNKILEAFVKQTLEDQFFFHDNPRGFIESFLDEQESYESAWAKGSDDEQLEAEAVLKLWHSTLSRRTPGELVYVMSFLDAAAAGAHLTLLGPTYFPTRDALNSFVEAASSFSEDAKELNLVVEEELSLAGSQIGLELVVHPVEVTNDLKMIHDGLRMLAQLHGGNLLEPHFADKGFLPHITHDRACQLKKGDIISISDMSITLHPGAKLNIKHAKTLARIAFRA